MALSLALLCLVFLSDPLRPYLVEDDLSDPLMSIVFSFFLFFSRSADGVSVLRGDPIGVYVGNFEILICLGLFLYLRTRTRATPTMMNTTTSTKIHPLLFPFSKVPVSATVSGS